MRSIMGKMAFGLPVIALLLGSASVTAQQVELGSGSIAETVAKLRPGEFVWAPQVAPQGPLLMIVNLRRQRALLFRNGVPVAATTVSTGKQGRETPTGVFTILQKHVEHYSSKYDNAPMPYMQRLTWQGVALHAGKLPGYPASHGCIRLPTAFAKLLYGVTTLGMTVVITSRDTQPRIAPVPSFFAGGESEKSPDAGPVDWQPAKSPSGPVSIVVSAADGRAVVLRNGVIIGSAPVTVRGAEHANWVYTLRDSGAAGKQWIRLPLSSRAGGEQPVDGSEWQRFDTPQWFRDALHGVVGAGTTIVVTADSLKSDAPPTSVPVIESAR